MATAAYANYDRAALDAQYDLRRAFPDFGAHLNAWIGRSRVTRESLRADLNVRYGDGARHVLDVFHPPTPDGSVLLFFHGGFWRALEKDTFSFVADSYARSGTTVVVPSYPLAPQARMGEIVAAAEVALRWTVRNVAMARPITVMGHSAGGHLAAMLTAASPLAGRIGACVGISGVYDLEPLRFTYLNDDLRLTTQDVEQFSPSRLAPGAAPTLVVVGDLETDEFKRLQADFVAARRGAGHATEEVPAPSLHHFDVLSECVTAGAALHEAIVAWQARTAGRPA